MIILDSIPGNNIINTVEKLDKSNIEDILALTPMQEGMLFHYLKDPGSEYYWEQLTLEISGEIDFERFERAWNVVIETNEMLRAVFRWEKVKKPLQIILKEHKLQPGYYDLSDRKGSEKKKRLEEIITGDSKEKFDLRNIPFRIILCKLQEARYAIIINNHHILYDGWSSGIILREFFGAYNDLSGGKRAVKPGKAKFKEFINWIQKQDTDKQEEFWKNYLMGIHTDTELSIKRKKEKPAVETGNYSMVLSGDTVIKWEDFTEKHAITLASLLYCAWGLLLQGYNNSDDVVFGTTVSGRSAKVQGIEEIVGLFINTVPLRVKSYSHETIEDLLYQTHRDLRTREAYEAASLVNIKEYSGKESGEELFDTIVVVENYPFDSASMLENGNLFVDSHRMIERTHYDLTVGITRFEGMQLNFTYSKEVIDGDIIIRLARHFRSLLEDVVENSGKAVHEIELLSEKEKKKIVLDFNDTAAKYPGERTILRLFEEQAARTPDSTAVVGAHELHELHEFERRKLPVHITYHELNRKSDQAAHGLKEKGVLVDGIVGIKMERSLEMIIGIFGTLKAGAAYLPIEPGYPQERIDFMLKDSGARILLTKLPEGHHFHHSSLITHHSGTLAYVIYTSGSTGRPKGVMVEHRSVVNILTALHRDYPLPGSDAYLLKTTFVFDVSVTELFGWFLEGGKLAVLGAGEEKDPTRILDTIEKYGITHINFVPSMFNAFLDVLTFQEVSKLSSLKYIFLAGEALLPEFVHKFRQLKPTIELENIYGPTEGTVYAGRYSLSDWEGSGSIPIGKPMSNVRLLVLNKYNNIQPVGVPGELGISGIGLARGYLNRPELTAEKFLVYYRSYRSYRTYIPSKKIYKTGDLARWLPDGNIRFLGRIDHQVKIRGYRIELGEIENHLLAHDEIKEAAVRVNVDKQGDKYLCAYIVPHSADSIDAARVKGYLQSKLPAYMVPAYFAMLREMPLTASGKLDRKALPGPGPISAGEHIPPGNEREELLAAIWSEILAVEEGQIGIDDNFFESGGHSLKAIGLVGRIHKVFDIELSLSELFKRPTIRGLSLALEKAQAGVYSPIEPAEEKEYYPFSTAQKRLFVLQQMDKNNTAYNMSRTLCIEGRLEKDRLEGVLRKLTRRHESLRTGFCIVDGQPVQRIYKEENSRFQIENYPLQTSKIIGDFVRPFDLSQTPLLRVGLIELDSRKHILMFDMHHIISDGFSLEIFVREFKTLYVEERLPALRLQYKDYSEWQNREKDNIEQKHREAYWLEEFSGEIPVLDLPIDYMRPAAQGFEGSIVRFEIDRARTLALKALALENGATLNMVLFALYNIFLFKISGQEEIVAGTPSAARRHPDLEPIIGMFVNMLALRSYPKGEKAFERFLKEVKENTLEALKNQDYPYEDLAERLALKRDFRRSPLFDAAFVLQNMEVTGIDIPWLKIRPYEDGNGRRTSKFDLTLEAVEENEKLGFTFEYRTSLFKTGTIERFTRYFKNVVSGIIGNPGGKISGIGIITREEKQQILFDFNNPAAAYPKDKTLHELFGLQVEKSPEKTAAVGKGASSPFDKEEKAGETVHLTYGELNRKADGLARLLRGKGVQPDTVVAIMMKRSIDMIIGILGILKAGGAYLPINPGNPPVRKQYMLKDSGARILVSEGSEVSKVSEEIDVVKINELSEQLPTHLCYVIYTSGSTGSPKGVPVTHANVCPLLYWGYKNLGLTSVDRVIQNLPFYFDWSVWEIFITLSTGAGLYITDEEVLHNPEAGIDFIRKNAVTTLHITPTQFHYYLNIDPPGKLETLKYLFIGAEKLSFEMVKRSFEVVNEDCRVFNMYGPTEAAIISSVLEIHRSKDNKTLEIDESETRSSIPIGKAAANANLLVLDRYLEMCPVNIPGELYISGDGLVMGYLNDPVKSSKAFVRDRYIPGGIAGERLYKTGDRVRWLADGNIEFLGRIDYQVKVRGYRIEPGEIENRLTALAGVKEAIVICREDEAGKKEKYLCAYIVCEDKEKIDITKLRNSLSGNLPGYMIPSYFVRLEEIPLNPNGKVDRKALPEPGTETGQGYLAPRDNVEETLAEIWGEVLGVEKDTVGIDANFFDLGGHSLKAALMAAKIHKVFDVNVPLVELFTTPFIKGLAEYIRRAGGERYSSIEPVEEREYHELSSAQERLYILHLRAPGSTGYNMPGVYLLKGRVNGKKFQGAFDQLIQRHEALRTCFLSIRGKPLQAILRKPGPGFQAGCFQCSEAGAYERIKNLVRPFDLGRAPLFRVQLLQIREEKFIVFFDMHHIISDGSSVEILAGEFAALYEGKHLDPLPIQYKDYAAWQDKQVHLAEYRRQEAYWLGKMEGLQFTRVPPDRLSAYKEVEGKKESLRIDAPVYEKIGVFCRKHELTKFVFMITLFEIILSREIEQPDITVGIPASVRKHADLKNVIGVFLNVILIRLFIDPGDTLLNCLFKGKTTVIEALNNQSYPYERLHYKIRKNNDFKEDELFTILFNYFPVEKSKEIVTGEFEMSAVDFPGVFPKYDITLYVFDHHDHDGMMVELVYKSGIYDEYTIKSILNDYKRVINLVLENEGAGIRDINLGDGEDIDDMDDVQGEFEVYYGEDVF